MNEFSIIYKHKHTINPRGGGILPIIGWEHNKHTHTHTKIAENIRTRAFQMLKKKLNKREKRKKKEKILLWFLTKQKLIIIECIDCK